jgi:hypothetical protein
MARAVPNLVAETPTIAAHDRKISFDLRTDINKALFVDLTTKHVGRSSENVSVISSHCKSEENEPWIR